MTVQEEKQSKYARGFTPRIDGELKPLVLEILSQRIQEERNVVSINQVVSDLVKAGIEKCYPSLLR